MTLELKSIVDQCNARVLKYSDYYIKKLSELSQKYKIGETFEKHGYTQNWMLHEIYYSYLLAYSELVDDKNILELGTQTGAGTVCFLSHGRTRKVLTADVNTGHISKEVLMEKDILVRHLRNADECTDFKFSDFETIFVDIGHDGHQEERIHYKLMNEKFKGIVLWDDIELNDDMKFFWKNIVQPTSAIWTCQKIETHWHGGCGFGIVKYG